MERLAEIAIGLPGHPQQQVGHGVAGESAIESERATAKRSKKGVEQKTADVKAELHRMLSVDEGQVVEIVVRVVVPALGQVGGTADGGKASKQDLPPSAVPPTCPRAGTTT